jgi:hypothetical protein
VKELWTCCGAFIVVLMYDDNGCMQRGMPIVLIMAESWGERIFLASWLMVAKWGARILHSFDRKETIETALVSVLSEFWLLSVSRQRWATRQGVSAMGRGALTDRARSSVRGSLNIGSRRGILL